MQIFRKILALTLAWTLTLSMGAVSAVAAGPQPEPSVGINISDSDGNWFDYKYGKAVIGETYTIKVKYTNNGAGFKPEDVTPTWAITDPSTADVVTLGTAGGNYADGYTNTITINKYGNFKLCLKLAEKNGNAFNSNTKIVTEPDPNAPFFAVIDRYGVEHKNQRRYPGETIKFENSINAKVLYGVTRTFVSSKLPISVSCDSSSYEFNLYNVRQKDNTFYASIQSKLKKEPTGTAEWEVADIGREFETVATIKFADGTSAQYGFYNIITQEPFGDHLKYERRVETGKTYNQEFEIVDKKDLLSDDTDIIAEWTVELGSNIVMLGASSVTVKAVGKTTPLTNTVKFTGRGAVEMYVDLTNSPKLTGDDEYSDLRDRNDITYIVSGTALPMNPDDITPAEGSDSSKTVIDVPSSNNLNKAALDKIVALAKAAGTDRIDLNLGEVTVGIGVSGLEDPDFLAAVEKNGGVFDPLITLAAPVQASTANISTGGGKWFDFAHSGKLPGEATISLNVSDFFSDAETLVLWYFNAATGRMEKQEEIAVDYDKESGYCSFKLDHCSAWALYPDIEGFDPNGDGGSNPPVRGDSSGRSDGKSAPSYPTADKGLADLAKIKDMTPANLPLNAKIVKTAAGKDIAVIPVTLVDGKMGVYDLNMLGKLGANVGLEAKQTGVDILIPGGFGAVTELGRFAYSMELSKLAVNSKDMLAAVKGTDPSSFTCTIGSDAVLPTTVTVTLTTSIKNDGNVNVYRYNAATGKLVFVAKSKLVGGKVVFATKQLGQLLVTTGTI